MKIALVSDVHTEHYPSDMGRKILQKISKTNADVLVVAGDLSTTQYIKYAFSILCDNFENVIFVPGNHEYYHSSIKQTNDILEECSNKHKNLHWLNNSSVNINDKTFIGGTLWYPKLKDGEEHFFKRFNKFNGNIEWLWSDFEVIKNFEYWYFEEHKKCKDFLFKNLKDGDIVVSHMLPTFNCVHERWKSSLTNCFFNARCDDILENITPSYWLFGHTHHRMNIKENGCVCLSNPVGYPNETSGYIETIIEV
jgi:predicted phosphodiesterase